MKIIIIICLAILLFIAEKNWAFLVSKKLFCSYKCSSNLAEPDEVVNVTCETKNAGKLPIMFVRVTVFLPPNTTLCDVEKKVRKTDGFLKDILEMKFSMAARSSVKRNIGISFPKRGVYRLDGMEMAVGDLLGFREESFLLRDDTRIVVMPKRCEEAAVKEVICGFLGDISVRRFIMEDPILTKGFREYTGYEPLKDVSWKRTAMSDRMMVKEYDHTSEVNVTILLNLYSGNEAQLEECYSLTRTVCDCLEEKKIEYGLRTNGGLFGPMGYVEWFPKGLGKKHRDSIMYSLGNARNVAYYSFETLVYRTIQNYRSNENYIVIVPYVDADVSKLISQLEKRTGNKVCVLNASREEK